MTLFKVPERPTKLDDKKLVQKTKTQRSKTTVRSKGIVDAINLARDEIEKHLGKYKDEYEIITSVTRLNNYLKNASYNGVISIDTETTGLDPILDKIVGVCIYTPNETVAYIPINHVSYITNERLDNQLTEEQVGKCFETWLVGSDAPNIIMFNAKFDIRVIRNQLNVFVNCYWDCYLAARLMNENEGSGNNGLKQLHQKYVLNDAEDEFTVTEYFGKLSFDKVPIDIAYLYGAHDAIVTYELYEFQKQYLYYEPECVREDRNGMNGVAWVFFNIEMPCVNVVCDMEDVGVAIDLEYAKELSERYHKLLSAAEIDVYTEISKYQDKIDAYVGTKLDNPINLNSSTQLAILFYDILKLPSVDNRKPRGTGEDILEKLKHPIGEKLLKYRAIIKLLNTYIDKLPIVVNSKDDRIHCNFNQYGADTGRFSSDKPNLQNIPSHNKDIRPMFVASEGYVWLSSDYSQQEPKCLAALCREHGDSQMYDTFMHGKDLYSEIASKAFNVPYEDCLEFNKDGTTNKAGKERRTQAKSILLGVLYGRGTASIAEQLNCTPDKAAQIKNSVFKGFPAIEKFEQDSLDMAYELGYVTTVCGRKRRLPDLQLDEFEFKWKDGVPYSNDLLDFDEELSDEVPESRVNYYLNKLKRCKFGEKRKVFEEANNEGIWIIDNGAKIADATRQCVNARIQGSAADLTKLAMVELNNNKRLKELGFRLLIQVHDEVIAECPEENVVEVKQLLADTMSYAAEEILHMPIKCDVDVTKRWYGEAI